jgi:hypothetical protein
MIVIAAELVRTCYRRWPSKSGTQRRTAPERTHASLTALPAATAIALIGPSPQALAGQPITSP